MSFIRLRPAGYPYKGNVTSSEFNQLDTDHANSLDKAGGDTITGPVTLENTITLTSAGTIEVESGGHITLDSGSSLSSAASASFSAGEVDISCSTLRLRAGASSLETDLLVTDNARIFSNGIVIQSQAGVNSTIGTQHLTTTSSGRFACGDNDYPILVNGHSGLTQVRDYSLGFLGAPMSGTANFTLAPDGILIAGTIPLVITVAFPPLWNGATLNSVEVFFTPNASHTGNPSTPPALTVYRKNIATGASVPSETVLGVTAQPYSPGADYADGKVKAWSFTCTIDNVIDSSQYIYYLRIEDENGTNAINGNYYHHTRLHYTISDIRPQ